jgi:pilus assembly protein Flp/PilA
MIKLIKKFRQDESGATAIEYGLIAALVSVAAITALGNLGSSLDSMFGTVSGHLQNAVASGSGTTPTPSPSPAPTPTP